MEKRFGVVEKRFDYKGHECLVVFTCRGVRNGYVSYKENVNYFDLDIDCHGGLTFSGKLPDYYEPTKNYYIGFDCGHLGDNEDYLQAYKYGLITMQELNMYNKLPFLIKHDYERVITFEEVEEDCKSIVDQLIKMEE